MTAAAQHRKPTPKKPETAPMRQPETLDTVAFMLGKIEGQLRELIHQSASTAQLVTAMGLRIAALEAELNQRKGASNLLVTVLKSPTIGWLAGAAISAWAILTNKVHLP